MDWPNPTPKTTYKNRVVAPTPLPRTKKKQETRPEPQPTEPPTKKKCISCSYPLSSSPSSPQSSQPLSAVASSCPPISPPRFWPRSRPTASKLMPTWKPATSAPKPLMMSNLMPRKCGRVSARTITSRWGKSLRVPTTHSLGRMCVARN